MIVVHAEWLPGQWRLPACPASTTLSCQYTVESGLVEIMRPERTVPQPDLILFQKRRHD